MYIRVVATRLVCTAFILAIGCSGGPEFDGRKLQSWIQDLGSEETETRTRAVEAVVALGKEDAHREHVLKSINKLFESGDDLSRSTACSALGSIASPEADRMLIDRSKRGTGAVRIAAIAGIGREGNDSEPVLGVLAAGLGDEEEQEAALAALVRVGGRRAASLLAAALAETRQPFRQAMIEILPAFGASASVAVPDLIRLLRGTDPLEAVAVQAALIAIGSDAVLPIADALRDPNAQVRRQAAITLAAIGVGARSAAPELAAMIEDSDPRCRVSAIRALGQIDGDETIVMPALFSALESLDPDTRFAAIGALIECNPNHVCAAASDILIRMKPISRLTPSIAENLKLQTSITMLFEDMGESARFCLDLLLREAGDSFPIVRKTAELALKRIDTN